MPLIHPALIHPALVASAPVPPPAPVPVLATGGAQTSVQPPVSLISSSMRPSPTVSPLVPERFLADETRQLSLPDLRGLAAGLAAAEYVWRPLVRHDPRQRWYIRLLLSGVVEVWLIGWYPGQQTEIHDHGGALGALAVAEGILDEDECGPDWAVTRTRRHHAGSHPGFGADHVHRVVNRGHGAATTIHAYSPPELPLRYRPADDRQPNRSVPAAPPATPPAVALGQALTAGAGV
ncbi:cysteine dioxygenase [Parafrankia sp. FMc2]|uniref:cysteine dioxygenase n=1 Tax=Parafrankia sp. FMc2 TaxID=3233196 RepID=UPI0034D4697B